MSASEPKGQGTCPERTQGEVEHLFVLGRRTCLCGQHGNPDWLAGLSGKVSGPGARFVTRQPSFDGAEFHGEDGG